MKILLTADLHLTDRPRDYYRWDLFPWLVKQIEKHKVDLVALLGDVTDAKNNHDEGLVNRVVDSLELLGQRTKVIFDPGNHDGIQEGKPFFRFSNHIKNVRCLTERLEITTPEKSMLSTPSKKHALTPASEKACFVTSQQQVLLFLPNTRDWRTAWKGTDFSPFDYIFCHQTFDGSISENGTELEGIPPSVFANCKAQVFSGDIHVPQKIGKQIEYVGAPYRIRYGDTFEPRVLLLDTASGKKTDLHFDTVMKFLVELRGDNPLELFRKRIKRLDARERDQVKIRVYLPREEYPAWPELRASLVEECSRLNLDLSGPELKNDTPEKSMLSTPQPNAAQTHPGERESLSPEEALRRYAKDKRLSPAMLKAGRGFLLPQ